jgi:hypothetical protein
MPPIICQKSYERKNIIYRQDNGDVVEISNMELKHALVVKGTNFVAIFFDTEIEADDYQDEKRVNVDDLEYRRLYIDGLCVDDETGCEIYDEAYLVVA